MNEEIWKAIPGFEDFYEVSNRGRIRQLAARRGTRQGRITTGTKHNRGYRYINLCGHSKEHRRVALVHRLVAEAFLGPCPEGMTVNHKNGDKTDNRAENLEYLTNGDNVKHAWSTGLVNNRGERNHHAVLNEDDVREIRRRRSEGAKLKELANEFGVTISNVGYIARGHTWRAAR